MCSNDLGQNCRITAASDLHIRVQTCADVLPNFQDVVYLLLLTVPRCLERTEQTLEAKLLTLKLRAADEILTS